MNDTTLHPTEQVTPLEKYYFEATFVTQHMPIDLKMWRAYVECPSVLHVNQMITAKIRAKYPTAESIEVNAVERADENFFAKRHAQSRSTTERYALLGALDYGYCLRGVACPSDGQKTHWRVGEKLIELGLFRRFFLDAKPAYVLSPEGKRVAEILYAWRLEAVSE